MAEQIQTAVEAAEFGSVAPVSHCFGWCGTAWDEQGSAQHRATGEMLRLRREPHLPVRFSWARSEGFEPPTF